MTPNEPNVVADEEREVVLLATPLRFAAMPADRYWQFENGEVNLGMLETQPHDLARLCLVEFATIYGNDWLVVPVDVDAGALTTVRGVSYTDTFGERLRVERANDANRPGTFRMFTITTGDGAGELDGLFAPPTMPQVQEGRAIEDVLFLRDETAAMGWAVERVVSGPSGDPRNRGDEPRPAPILSAHGSWRGARLRVGDAGSRQLDSARSGVGGNRRGSLTKRSHAQGWRAGAGTRHHPAADAADHSQ